MPVLMNVFFCALSADWVLLVFQIHNLSSLFHAKVILFNNNFQHVFIKTFTPVQRSFLRFAFIGWFNADWHGGLYAY